MRASIDKDRDMARSILPSKNREAARSAKAHLKRAARRRCHRACDGLAKLDSYRSDDWDARFDLRAYPAAEIHLVVRWRRAGDKLNHFERWTIARTKGLPIDDRLGSIIAVLPDGLTGDHALSHLRRLAEINPGAPRFWWNPWVRLAELEDPGPLPEPIYRLMREAEWGVSTTGAGNYWTSKRWRSWLGGA
jgi:hypothetical protein